jgi:hypothetical protein
MALFVAKGESGFQRLPKGKQILLVKGVEFDPDFFTDTMAEVVVVLATQSGITHKETFNVASEGGSKAFTFMIKTIHNRFDIKEGESLDELVETAAGNYIETTVEWVDAKDRAGNLIKTRSGEQVINVRLNEKKHSTGWGVAADETADDIEPSDEVEVSGETEDFQF